MMGADNVPGLRTVVIDAGHGGHDPGAVSKDGRTKEKDLTLDISKKLAEKIRTAYPDVKVILTRDSDKYVELGDRAAKANKANANLFISIHINAAKSTSANGYSVHILGQSSDKNKDLYEYNMNVCKRENSVILLEDDYSTKYEGFDPDVPESYIFMQLMQSAYLEQSMNFAEVVSSKLKGGPVTADRGIWQNPFLVLWRTSMPAVLVELGFISNSTDLSILRSDTCRDDIAGRLFKAFSEYKKQYDRSVSASDSDSPGAVVPSDVQSPVQEAQEVSEVQYGIQIFSGSNLLNPSSRQFLGYRPRIIKAGNIYKYIIAVSGSSEESCSHLVEIRKTYKDAFPVRIDGEKVTLLK